VQSVPVYGEVPAQADQPEGTYTDTVTATVTF
jgi:spore coat protein U-like protein